MTEIDLREPPPEHEHRPTSVPLGDDADGPGSRAGTRVTLDQAVVALRALPFGGLDDGSLGLRLPPAVQATVSPVIAAVRWGAVMFGMVTAVSRAASGSLDVVGALVIVLFLTTWRTLRPIRLGSSRLLDRVLAVTDTIAVGLAVGGSGAFDSPFVLSVLATAIVGAFGWGVLAGLGLIAVAVGSIAAGTMLFDDPFRPFDGQAPVIGASLVVTVAIVAFARTRLLEAEKRRASLTGQLDLLSEANDLLHILNQLARTLPRSLDLREAVGAARDELRRTFDADVVALVTLDEATEEWVPQLTDGCAMRPSSTVSELPSVLARAVTATRPVLVTDLEGSGLHARSRSGLYSTVSARGRIVGLVGVERRGSDVFGERHRRLLEGLGEVLALTVDNARSFRKLRTLGADEERSRIARDLHDRLGQWLSYISFELERIITTEPERSPELDRLYGDVQTAMDELRETLRQLRAEVTEARPLAAVAQELLDRFSERTEGVQTSLAVTSPGRRLPLRVEQELLRILQEALSNIAKHAAATTVTVTWDVDDEHGTLTIVDDGKGFDPDRGIRDSAYGLVGMQERAGVAGARLTVSSRPGAGTTITIRAPGTPVRAREEATT